MIAKTLESGKQLEIKVGKYEECLELQQAIAEEAKGISLHMDTELEDPNFMKDIICSLIASKRIMNIVHQLLKNCTYEKIRIMGDVYEQESFREDFYEIVIEVIKANVGPFMKGLIAKLKPFLNARMTVSK